MRGCYSWKSVASSLSFQSQRTRSRNAWFRGLQSGRRNLADKGPPELSYVRAGTHLPDKVLLQSRRWKAVISFDKTSADSPAQLPLKTCSRVPGALRSSSKNRIVWRISQCKMGALCGPSVKMAPTCGSLDGASLVPTEDANIGGWSSVSSTNSRTNQPSVRQLRRYTSALITETPEQVPILLLSITWRMIIDVAN